VHQHPSARALPHHRAQADVVVVPMRKQQHADVLDPMTQATELVGQCHEGLWSSDPAIHEQEAALVPEQVRIDLGQPGRAGWQEQPVDAGRDFRGPRGCTLHGRKFYLFVCNPRYTGRPAGRRAGAFGERDFGSKETTNGFPGKHPAHARRPAGARRCPDPRASRACRPGGGAASGARGDDQGLPGRRALPGAPAHALGGLRGRARLLLWGRGPGRLRLRLQRLGA